MLLSLTTKLFAISLFSSTSSSISLPQKGLLRETFSSVILQTYENFFSLLQTIPPVLTRNQVAPSFFGRPGDLLPANILSLDILNIHSRYMLIPFSFSPFHQLFFNWLDTLGFSDFLISYSIYFCFANYFPQYFHLICFQHFSSFFLSSALFSRASIIIGRTIALYIFDFVSFFIYLFLQTRSSQPLLLLFELGFQLIVPTSLN